MAQECSSTFDRTCPSRGRPQQTTYGVIVSSSTGCSLRLRVLENYRCARRTICAAGQRTPNSEISTVVAETFCLLSILHCCSTTSSTDSEWWSGVFRFFQCAWTTGVSNNPPTNHAHVENIYRWVDECALLAKYVSHSTSKPVATCPLDKPIIYMPSFFRLQFLSFFTPHLI